MSSGIISNKPTTLASTLRGTAHRLLYINNLGQVVELAYGTSGQVLASAGTTSAPIFTTLASTSDMVGADGFIAGSHGLVPAPGATDNVNFLRGDGLWAAGTPGPTGAAGSVWFQGSGAPSGGTGVNGDFYLRTSNGDVYTKSGGTWSVIVNIMGPTGSTGSAGAAGATLRNGAGAPSNGLGVNGDYYLNNTNDDLYFKAAGAYTVVANFKGSTGSTGSTGAAGADGSIWRSGSGAPSNGLGVNGDYYLNTANGDVYFKASGSYTVVTNIVGPTGAVMVASGAGHAAGIAPDPGAVAGTTRFLCEDATYRVPAGGGGGSFDQVEVWLF